MSETKYSHLKTRIDTGVLVITITVSHLQDEKIAQAIQDELLAAVSEARVPRVVIDLQNIRYISSVAFRPFLRLRRELHDNGGRLILCSLSQVIGDVFYTTRLVCSDGSFAAPFEMAIDVPAAISQLASTAG